MTLNDSDIEEVFRLHRAKMQRLAALLLRDESEADDAVSEVWMKLYRKRPLDGVENVEAFLLTAIRNHCINVKKARTREPVLISANELLVDRERSTPPDDSYLDSAEANESRLQDIETFINERLTEQTQRVLKLRFHNKMKYAEIARELGISEAAVYKHLSQGLEKLKKQFNP